MASDPPQMNRSPLQPSQPAHPVSWLGALRVSITTKLFLVIAIISVVAIASMGGAMWLSLDHSFSAFNQKQDELRAQAMTETLADLYTDHQNWLFIQEHPQLWWDILRTDGFWRDTEPAKTVLRERLKNWAAHGGEHLMHPPRETPVTGMGMPHAGTASGPVSDSDQPPPFAGMQRPPGWGGPNPHGDVFRLRRYAHWSLLDASGQVIAGSNELSPTTRRYAINVHNQTVGWLAVSPRDRRVTQVEQNFLTEQRHSSVLIMIGAVLLALVASLLFARAFLAPVRRLVVATKKLTASQYDTRVAVTQRDELGQLAADFNQLAATLQRNERMRREFVADISHELRTPLAILKGELEAIQDGIRKPTPEAMASLQSEAEVLSQLIDDLYQLSLSDVGGLRFHIQPMDIKARLGQLVQTFEERFKTKSLHLAVTWPQEAVVMLDGDAMRLEQLFKNLLENTLRYTDPEGRVQLSMTIKGSWIHVHIQDSEPGVADHELPRLFERLYRVENSRNRMTGGAGLGLALCQTIAEAHGGEIIARHSPLGGLWVEVILPLKSD